MSRDFDGIYCIVDGVSNIESEMSNFADEPSLLRIAFLSLGPQFGSLLLTGFRTWLIHFLIIADLDCKFILKGFILHLGYIPYKNNQCKLEVKS